MNDNKITEKKKYYLRLPRASTGFVVDHSLEPTPLTVFIYNGNKKRAEAGSNPISKANFGAT